MPHDTELQIPPVSALLRAAYERSGLAVSAMSNATGISKSSIHIAMSGIRYRDAKPIVTSPPDRTIVKLASLLRISPQQIREAGRERAAQLLEEIPDGQLPTSAPTDRYAQSQATGRTLLLRQVLSVFSTDELKAEVKRREDRADDDELYNQQYDEELHRDLSETLDTDRWPQ